MDASGPSGPHHPRGATVAQPWPAGCVSLPPLGTQLLDLSTEPLLFTTAPGAPFAIPTPNHCGLVGVTVLAQGLSAGVATAALAGGLDVTIGNH